MSVKTFFPMVFGRAPFSWLIGSWPRRFTDGFQRLWERVAWRIDVRLNVNIKQIKRSTDGIQIDMEYPQQNDNALEIVKDTQRYDYLILACPLMPPVFAQLGLLRNPDEQYVTDQIQFNPYCMTSLWPVARSNWGPSSPSTPANALPAITLTSAAVASGPWVNSIMNPIAPTAASEATLIVSSQCV